MGVALPDERFEGMLDNVILFCYSRAVLSPPVFRHAKSKLVTRGMLHRSSADKGSITYAMRETTSLVLVIAAISLLLAASPAAAAWIIDINAVSNGYTNPVTVSMNAGTYTVTPLGQANGGRYSAWNANWGNPGYWSSAYFIDVPGTGVLGGGGVGPYGAAGTAYANAFWPSSFTFTLSTPGTVSFGIGDTTYADNIGGMSLLVANNSSGPYQAVPNPQPLSNGWIVDINAVSNGQNNPLGLQLAAGWYTVTPVNQAQGGAYTAWNANLGNPDWWSSGFFIDVPGTGILYGGGAGPYPTAGDAYANAFWPSNFTFHLSSAGTVHFGMIDSGYDDNLGGVSLQIRPVPLPPSMFLLGPALAGLYGFRRRLKR